MAQLFNVLREKWTTVPTPALPLSGQTVLITGANTGLGLETAKKLAVLQPKRLIITTRSVSKGEETVKEIQNHLRKMKSTSDTKIIPLILDMSTFDGVEEFVKTLTRTMERLDGAILNAGVNGPRYSPGAEGYDNFIQVNAISTIYLAVLLLPLMMSTAKDTGSQTHLTFVSSRVAVGVPSASLPPYLASDTPPMKFMSQPENFPAGAMGGQARYGDSKLLLEYGMRNLVQLPSLKDQHGKPYVIINSVCPGVCKSDLARSYDAFGMQFFINYVFIPLLAKPSEQGAVCYLRAYSHGEESHGKLSGSGRDYIETWDALTSDPGKELNRRAWVEMVQIMRNRKEPSVSKILGQS